VTRIRVGEGGTKRGNRGCQGFSLDHIGSTEPSGKNRENCSFKLMTAVDKGKGGKAKWVKIGGLEETKSKPCFHRDGRKRGTGGGGGGVRRENERNFH